VDGPRVFANLGPTAGTDEINKTYVMPNDGDPNSYVLSLEPPQDPEHVVVLFADWTVEVADKLPIQHNDAPVTPGSTVQGGIITFAGGSAVYLSQTSSVTVVQSFITKDGTPYHVVKVEHSGTADMTAVSADASIVVVSTSTGTALVRTGAADVQQIPGSSDLQLKVGAYSGETLITGAQILERGEGSASPSGSEAAGVVNVNPTNGNDFEFQLNKPDGSVITRDDLMASGGTLDYRGPATQVRFKPKGNGNQNSLQLNGQPYPLQNGTLYTLSSDNMTLHLYNDKGGRGNAMGRWWMDEITATNAVIYEGDQPPVVDPGLNTGYTVGTVILKNDALNCSVTRTLSRGASVQPGWWALAVKW